MKHLSAGNLNTLAAQQADRASKRATACLTEVDAKAYLNRRARRAIAKAEQGKKVGDWGYVSAGLQLDPKFSHLAFKG